MAVSLKGENGNDDDYRYLLSKKPGLTAFGLGYRIDTLLLTAAQLSRMRDLQHLQIECFLDAKTVRVMFQNAKFDQLLTLRLEGMVEWKDAAIHLRGNDECGDEALKVRIDLLPCLLLLVGLC